MAKPIKRDSCRWQIRWTDSGGKRRAETFTSYSSAQKALRRKLVVVEERRAGIAQPTQQPQRSFDDLADYL